MVRSKQKGKPATPHVKINPSTEVQVRNEFKPRSTATHKLSWQLGAFDWTGPWCGSHVDRSSLLELIASKIKAFESMTWGELKDDHHHYIEVSKLNKVAEDRLSEIKQDDVDQIFSLRLNGTHRLYGIRAGAALKVLWYDVGHGDNGDCVCRSVLKHT